MRRAPNLTTLAVGIALIVLGVLLVLEQQGRVTLGFAYTGPVLVAGVGAVLLVNGLAARRRG